MIGGPAQNKGAQDSVENSTHINTIANLLIVEVRDAQNLYSVIIYQIINSIWNQLNEDL